MNTGFNGSNWFAAMQPGDEALILSMLVESGLPSLTLRFRADDTANPLDNVPALIELDNYLDGLGKGLNVIFTADMAHDTSATIEAITTLINAGVNIIGIQAGNEPYSSVHFGFDFDAYKAAYAPLRDACYALWDIPFILFLAPRPKESGVNGSSTTHSTWNNRVRDEFVANPNPKDAVAIHLYLNEKEFPGVGTPPAKRVVDSGVVDEELDNYYKDLFYAGINSDRFEKADLYLRDYFTGRKAFVTEFGFSNSGELKNTIAYSAVMFKLWLTYRDRFEAFLQHNGIARTNTGFLTPAHDTLDLVEFKDTNVARTDLFTFVLQGYANGVVANIGDLTAETHINIEGDSGERYYFTVKDNVETQDVSRVFFDTADDVRVSKAEVAMLRGNNFYSSSGFQPFMERGSTADYEIAGIELDTEEATSGESIEWVDIGGSGLQAIVIKVVLEKIVTEPERPWFCKRFGWLFPKRCNGK